MSRQAYPTQLRDHLGNEVRLPSKPFAVGGEGAVFDVLGRPDLVAKLYSKPQSKERCDKLRAMAKLCSPDLLKIAAWPTATLSNGQPRGRRRHPDAPDRRTTSRSITSTASPSARRISPRRTGDSCSTRHGIAPSPSRRSTSTGTSSGDVNQKNVMVSKKGIVALVDCDSFQVAEGTRIFRCGVGVPEYTPPELHGKNFASLDRAAEPRPVRPGRAGLPPADDGPPSLLRRAAGQGRHPDREGDPGRLLRLHTQYGHGPAQAAAARPAGDDARPAMLDLFERAFGSTPPPHGDRVAGVARRGDEAASSAARTIRSTPTWRRRASARGAS